MSLRSLYWKIRARFLFRRFVRRFGNNAPAAISRAYPGTKPMWSEGGKTLTYSLPCGTVFTFRYDNGHKLAEKARE